MFHVSLVTCLSPQSSQSMCEARQKTATSFRMSLSCTLLHTLYTAHSYTLLHTLYTAHCTYLHTAAHPVHCTRVMLIFEDVMFPLWNHLFWGYPCYADFKTASVFKLLTPSNHKGEKSEIFTESCF